MGQIVKTVWVFRVGKELRKLITVLNLEILLDSGYHLYEYVGFHIIQNTFKILCACA